jgi:hypothetical protein
MFARLDRFSFRHDYVKTCAAGGNLQSDHWPLLASFQLDNPTETTHAPTATEQNATVVPRVVSYSPLNLLIVVLCSLLLIFLCCIFPCGSWWYATRRNGQAAAAAAANNGVTGPLAIHPGTGQAQHGQYAELQVDGQPE